MPYRSHVQHDEFDETELGELLWLLRELSEGTSEPESVSESVSESEPSESESSSCCAVNLAESISTVGFVNRSVVICCVAFGFVGRGDWIWEGESERPFATAVWLMRREWRLDRLVPLSGGLDGISRMLSLRPVFGSVTDSRAGS